MHRGQRNARGASLIEILVAVLILSVGVLGLAAMQVRSMRTTISSEQKTQAVILAHYLLDLMRVDRSSAVQGLYNTAGGLAAPLCALPAAGAFASSELRSWMASVQAGLGPAAVASTCVAVDCDALGLCSVRLQWDDTAAGGLPDQSLTVTSRI
jgi:type IV pilus assembly protein PilV